MSDDRPSRWDDHKTRTLQFVLAASALPAWAALVALGLYVALPAIQTTKDLTEVVALMQQRQAQQIAATELHARQLSELLNANVVQTERLSTLTSAVAKHDTRLDRIEDNIRPWRPK